MDNRWTERDGGPRRESRQGTIVAGVLFIALGAALLVNNQLNVDWDRYGWPVFVIAPGIFLLLVGLAIRNEAGLGMAIPGGIITSVGLLLAFQNATGAWASWAYSWALVAPGSVGVTIAAYGLLHRRLDLLDAGLRTAATGLGLFVGFGLFFENIVGIDSGHESTALQNALPVVAIVLGALIVSVNLLPRPGSRSGRVGPDDWSAGGAGPSATPTSPESPTGPRS